ncbi:hypothetical protein AHAS_Ahas14G0098700 [Arachis hypogaea]
MKRKKKQKTKNKKASSSESDPSESELDFSSESESEENLEEPRRKQPTRTAKKMESRKKKQILEDSTSESETESNYEMQSKKRKQIVEDSFSEEQIQSYDVKKKAGVPSTEGHYNSTETNPAPKATAALMMMAHIASYVPKEFSMPSFSLGFTDSSQEETLTQEGQPGSQKGKSSETPILIEQLEELVEKIANSGVKAAVDFAEGKSPLIEKQPSGQIFENFETPARSKEMLGDMREKCYLWATRVKTYADGTTNEYNPVCTLNA